MTNPIDKWTGDFGDKYHQRNVHDAVNLPRTHLMNQMIVDICAANHSLKNILEIGAGLGQNLDAIAKLNLGCTLNAIEPNYQAALNLREIAHSVHNCDWENFSTTQKYDLVFTSGVLIHVPPNNIDAFTKKIYDASNKYVVAIEYFSAETREIKYHGEDGLLWTRDYGKYYLDLGMRLLSCKFFYKPLTDLDNLTMWVFQK